jgi:hypothetical protein
MRLASTGVRVRGVRRRALSRPVLATALTAACSLLAATEPAGAALHGPPVTAALHDVVAIAADDAWAVGTSGLASHWNGMSWASQHLGGLHSPELNSVAAISTEDVWAVGGVIVQDQFRGFASHWDGTAWHRAPVPGPAAEMTLEDVSMAATDDVWAVGRYFSVTPGGRERGGILIHWNGSRWSKVASLPGTSLAAVTAPKPGRVLVLAQGRGRPYLITSTNGAWRTVLLPPVPAGTRCVGRDLDAAPAIVVGTCRSGGRSDPYIAERRPDGTWRVPSIPLSASLLGVDQGVATWTVGGSGPATARRSVILRRGGNGAWFRVQAPNPGRSSLLSVSSRRFGDAWAVGWHRPRSHPGDLPLALHWDGAAWSRVPVPIP